MSWSLEIEETEHLAEILQSDKLSKEDKHLIIMIINKFSFALGTVHGYEQAKEFNKEVNK